MKISIKIAAALLALGLASRASADPVVYLTGSSAFRSTIYSALSSSYPTNSPYTIFDSNTVSFVTYGTSASPSGANYMVFHGNIDGNPVYVNCAWSGSEAGIASACNVTLTNKIDNSGNTAPLPGSPEAWVDVTKIPALTIGAGDVGNFTTNPGTSLMENGGVPYHGSDLAQADTSQAVSWTPKVAGSQTDLYNFGIEGVVTFSWSRNVNTQPNQAFLDLTNVTIPQLNVLLASGAVQASFFTGNPADTNYVYCVGRNMGSGTRMNTLADTTFGTHNTVIQFSIGGGVSTATTGNLQLALENNNGYDSGGGVASAMAIDGSCQQADPFFGNTGWFALAYSSPGDLLGHGVTTNYWVTMDGVLESNASIENGQCWFWGREHLYGRHGIDANNTDFTVGQRLESAIQQFLLGTGLGSVPGNHDSGIPLALMNVNKASDVAFPTPGQQGQDTLGY